MKTQAVKYKNQIWCEVWKDGDFDVIDLDIQIADLEALIHTQANVLTDIKAENRQQAEQIHNMGETIAHYHTRVHNEVRNNTKCLQENQRLKELILQGEDFIEEEWQTVRSFGVLRAKQWYGGMMDEIAKIKAAQPQKGVSDE